MDMLLGILQRGSRAARRVPRRQRCDAQAHVNTVLKVPARGDARFPREDRPAVPRDAPDQGRGRGAGPRLGREPRARIRGPAERAARAAGAVRQRFPAAGRALDDLFAHFKSVRELVDRARRPARRRAARAPLAARRDGDRCPRSIRRRRSAAKPAQDVTSGLERWRSASRPITARRCGSRRAARAGAGRLPAQRCGTSRSSSSATRSCTASRTPAQRLAAARVEAGTLQLEFHAGHRTASNWSSRTTAPASSRSGIAMRRCGAATSSPEEAQALDAQGDYRADLPAGLLDPGRQASRDAGRGVGLDLVWRTVQALGGRIRCRLHPASSRASDPAAARSSCSRARSPDVAPGSSR